MNEPHAASLTVVIVPAHTTTHLPPDRAVITTPALVALMEQCIAAAEAHRTGGAQPWRSTAADVKHRAGAKAGETLQLKAEPAGGDDHATWVITATAADGRLIAEGTIERAREAACPG